MGPSEKFDVRGRRVVVVGAARSGVAVADLLVSRGAVVTLTDTRPAIEDESALRLRGIVLELGGHRTETLTRADLIVISPGVPPRQPALDAARAAGVPVTGELELASRWLLGRIVAITGTKGKSTTTTLTGRMFEAGGRRTRVGGNIGLALSAQVGDSTPDTIHVVEVSSFQLEMTERFHPWIAALLNFSPDHLDRHASVEEYAGAKARIFANQTPADWAVVNADDEPALQLAAAASAKPFRFSMSGDLRGQHDGVVIAGDLIVHRTSEGDVPLVPLASVRLLGRHLLSDVLAAASIARIAGIAPEAMTRAVEGFTGLEHALEPAGEAGGVRFVNDSKATNVAAARLAIESFDRGLVVILGGKFKGGDFRDLREPLATRADAVIAIGEAADLVVEALEGAVPVRRAASMSDAVRSAYAAASPGGTVLLAPACASFDMFRDYAERGRVFKGEVERLMREVERTREQ
jgi:UDP-N-acetylmuramoylalanine--D-glutamate ligase